MSILYFAVFRWSGVIFYNWVKISVAFSYLMEKVIKLKWNLREYVDLRFFYEERLMYQKFYGSN